MSKHLYLRKANNDLVCHCRCSAESALITSPAQVDCPWCGCGWLFICGQCGMPFTFAEPFQTSESWEQIANRVMPRYGSNTEPTAAEAEQWIGFMKILVKSVVVGQKYVYFDGWVIPTNSSGVHIEGWHSKHDLETVPHVAALTGKQAVTNVLGSIEYWRSTKIS